MEEKSKINTYRYFIFNIKEYFNNQHSKLENRKFQSIRYLLKDYIELDTQIRLNVSDGDKLKKSKDALLQNILFYLKNSPLKKYKEFEKDIKILIDIIDNKKTKEDKEEKNIQVKEEERIHTITPFYKKINKYNIIDVWIDILINNVKAYDDVDKLIDCYVSELLFEGYSLEYLKEWWVENCNYKYNKKAGSEEELLHIIDKFKLLSHKYNKKYKIIFKLRLPKRLKDELRKDKCLLIKGIKCKSVNEDLYKENEKFFVNNFDYVEVEIEACDKYRALDLAIYSIETYMDIYRVIDNSIKPINSCLFVGEEKEELSIHNKSKYTNKELTIREKKDIEDFIDLRDKLRRDSEICKPVDEIESIINIIHKMSEFTTENKILNAWGSLENIVSSYTGASIIEKVTTIVPKIITTYMMKQKLNNLWDRLLPLIPKLNCNEIEKCRREDNPKKYNNKIFAEYLLKEETSKKLYESISNNTVISRNIAEIHKLLRDPNALLKQLEFFEESIRHNINSLYRLRNNIVHNSGKVDISAEYNIMTLQYYLNSILGMLIHHIGDNSQLIIEEILHSIVVTYDSYIKGIRELGNKINGKDKNINKEQEVLKYGMDNIVFIKYLYL
ncbi:hypothetical protein [Clostridium felsineum]|uniref:Uncharacterized protein n=1 Tax=Clostridium felsineum TaxID=36839 RepID=A0A1S8L9E5_9CLOT|nr:hypothetical protein [Clostridium felsineum]URZ05172.1 hypothetical protein CLROS_004960 [Clostridium felsineum]URZ10213.1 hypothetical protein CROST_009210 [Clostridium felsineum]